MLGAEEPVEIPERPYVLEAIILANIIVYAVTSASHFFMQSDMSWIARLGYIPAMMLIRPESAYRIFTAMFTHADIFHIFFNMYFLYIFGRAVERTLGHWRFLILYLLSGVFAAVFHTVFIYVQSPADLAIPSVGASGAISGVLGAYMLLYPGTRLTACFFLFFLPVCFEMLAAYYILFWFAVQVLEGYFSFSSNIAFFAHAGGFLAGIALLPLVADEARIRYLRLLSRAQRLFGIIVFMPYQLQRRGLSPGTKSAFILLAGLLLGGTAFAYIYATTHPSMMAGYSVTWSLGGEKGSAPAFVGIAGGHAYPIPTAAPPAAQLAVNILHRYGLFYNPSYAGKEIMLAPPLIEPVTLPIYQTLYITLPLRIEPRLIEATFNNLGILKEARLDVVISRGLLAAPYKAEVVLRGLGDPIPLIRAMALLSFLVSLTSLYVVAYRDEDYVITPE